MTEKTETMQLRLQGYGIILWTSVSGGPPNRIDDTFIFETKPEKFNEYDLMSTMYEYVRNEQQKCWELDERCST